MAKNLNISNISTNSGAAAGLSKGVSSSTINSTAGTSIKPSSSSSRYYHSAGSRSSYHSATSHYDLQLMVTELFNACKSGDCAGIARYCQTTPKAVNVLLNYRDLNGNTGILYASANGHLEVVKLILKVGLNFFFTNLMDFFVDFISLIINAFVWIMLIFPYLTRFNQS